MFIKVFLYANTEDESMKIITDILSPLNIEIGKNMSIPFYETITHPNNLLFPAKW